MCTSENMLGIEVAYFDLKFVVHVPEYIAHLLSFNGSLGY